MSLFGRQSNATQNSRLLGYRVQTSILGSPIPIIFGMNRVPGNVIWTGHWQTIKVQQGGKGGGKGSSKGGADGGYKYRTAAAIAICEGPVTGMFRVWQDKTLFNVVTVAEDYTVPSGGGNFTPLNASSFVADTGVRKTAAYSVTANDYGSPGSVTLAGNQAIRSAKVASAPAAGQYAVNTSTGIYAFSGADAGITFSVSYVCIVANPVQGQTVPNLNLALFNGTLGQTPWAYLTSNFFEAAIGYSQIAYVANDSIDLGTAGTIGNLSFEMGGLLPFGGGVVDSLCADVMVTLLTDTFVGAGLALADVSDINVANYCKAHSLFVSPAIDQQRTAADWLTGLGSIANMEYVWSEGLVKLRSRGDTTAVGNGATFSPDTQPVFDLGLQDFQDAKEPVRIMRPAARDRYNAVKVDWTNRLNEYNTETVEDKDDLSISLYGLRPMSPIQALGICLQPVAAQVANIQLKRNIYFSTRYNFTLGYQYVVLEPMDVVTLTSPYQGLNRKPVRIISIDEDDKGVLSIEAEEFTWGAATPTLHPKQYAGGFTPGYYAQSGSINAPIFFEATEEMTQKIGFALLIALSGGANWGGCSIHVSEDGTTYEYAGKIIGPSSMGVTTGSIPYAADPDTTNTLAVDLTTSLGTLASASQSQADQFASLALIDGELIAYTSAALTGNYAYNLTGYIRRGVFDTPITPHASGVPFVALDGSEFDFPYQKTDIGKLKYFKFTSFNQSGQNEQDISTVPAYQYRLTGGFQRPPYTLKPSQLAPPSYDSMSKKYTFGVQQAYASDAAVIPIAGVNVFGQLAVNKPTTAIIPPVITGYTTSSTGGTMPGGSVFLIGATGLDANVFLTPAGETLLSNITAITVPVGTNTNKVTLNITWGPSTAMGFLYAGTPEDLMEIAALPVTPSATVDLTSYAPQRLNGPPDKRFDSLLIQSRQIIHGGVAGGIVTGVTATTITIALGLTSENFTGYDVSLYAKGDISQVFCSLNLAIASNTANVFTFSGTGDLRTLVAAGDVLVIRSNPSGSSTKRKLIDPLWVNGIGSGLAVNAEKGNAVVIFGSAMEIVEEVLIDSNDGTSVTLSKPLTFTPTSSTRFAIVGKLWDEQPTASLSVANSLGQSGMITTAFVPNTAAGSFLFRMLVVDSKGNRSPENNAQTREVYMFGQLGGTALPVGAAY